MRVSVHRAFALVATVAVLAAVAWGFVLAGSPQTRRTERMDERRLDELQAIHQAIQNMVLEPGRPLRLKAALPASLADVVAHARHKLSTVDPESGELYEYRVVGPSTYVLCATFRLPRTSRRNVFWNHDTGRACFTIDALDPP